MDTSYWVDRSQSIKTGITKKQYFGRYLWRLVYNIRRINVINDKRVTDIRAYVIQEQEYERNAAQVRYIRYSSRWEHVDITLLERVRVVTVAHKNLIKTRTETDNLQIYAEDEQTLKDIAAQIDYDQGLEMISGPKPGTETLLTGDAIFMNNMPYKFKVILRDGSYSPAIKKSVLAQLESHEDVKIPNSLSYLLRKNYAALWGGYFYCNDDSITTFLSLISPGIVGKIHPVISDL